MRLTYEAVSKEGNHSTDTVEAVDVKEAVEQLRRRGLYVSRIEESSGHPSKRSAVLKSAAKLKMSGKALVVFTRQMAMLLRSGSSVVPAIASIRRQTTKPNQIAILDCIIDDLEQGVTMTEAFRKHPNTFDPVYCAVVSAGEASATLTEMFERLASIVRDRRVLRNQIIGACAYPALLVVMSIKILLALLIFVIPRFSGMFEQLGVDPPATTKMMLAFSDGITSHWAMIVFGVVACIVGTVVTLYSARGRQWLSDIQLSIPLFGRLRSSLIQGQIFRTMGTLLESGVGVLDTFGLARESTRNSRIQRVFDELEETVTSGGTLAPAFERSGLVEPYICQAIHTGEDSGNLGSALTYAADLLDETNAELIRTTLKLLEPVILIGLGFVVGLVSISLFLPLFDLTSAMG